MREWGLLDNIVDFGGSDESNVLDIQSAQVKAPTTFLEAILSASRPAAIFESRNNRVARCCKELEEVLEAMGP